MVELATPPGGTARTHRDQLQERQRRAAAVDEGHADRRAIRSGTSAPSPKPCSMPRCGVTCRPGLWLWIRPTSRLGAGASPQSARRRRPRLASAARIIRSRRRIRHIRMPAGVAPPPGRPVGADGRYIYTADMDARMGWRSSEFEETIFFCGYDLHVITDVPSVPGRGPVVHVARAMNLSPAGSHKGIGGLPAVHALGDTIGKPRQLIADRAYNYVTNDTFALPVWQLGYTTIYDLHPKQRGTHPGPDGNDTLWIDGILYPTSLPAGLHDIEPIDTKMDVGVRGRLDRRHQARQAYAFVPHGARQP